MAHLHYTPLPGSEKCIREPWRNAAARLIALHGGEGVGLAKAIFTDKTSEIDMLSKMIDKNFNTVYAGTCGRLFDAVSTICGVTKVSSYDGEVIRGLISPKECSLFGKACHPMNPIGPCMVSAEGSCAAYYQYMRESF
jgi:hydrogenase maturation factor HypF (carbamoyltransferase family)